MIRRLLLALALCCGAAGAHAATCPSLPYTLTNGTLADATKVMANFNGLLTCVNDTNATLPDLSCPSITLFGGKGDGTTNNVAAFQAALAATPTKPCVYFPSGEYVLNSPISYTMPADGVTLTIKGDGQNASQLVWPNSGGGLNIVYAGHQNSFNLLGLTLATGQAGGGTGLTLTQNSTGTAGDAPTVIREVSFRGSDGYIATDYWNTAIRGNSVNNVNFISDFIAGSGTFNAIGIDLEGTVSIPSAAAYNIVATYFLCLDKGIIYGDYVQGVTVSGGSNFTCGNVGIDVTGTAGTDQLIVTGAQFEVNTAGIRGGVNGTTISNNLFITDHTGSIGIDHSANDTFVINGNEFQVGTASGYGVKVTAGTGSIASNNFVNQGTDIYLGSGTGSVLVPDTNVHSTPSTAAITNLNPGNRVDGTFGWTPTFVGSGTAGSPTYNIQIGSYTRTSDLVTAQFHVGMTALGGLAGNLQIGGLPFANGAGVDGSCSYSYMFGIAPASGFTMLTGVLASSATKADVWQSSGSATQKVTDGQLTPTVELIGTCSYSP